MKALSLIRKQLDDLVLKVECRTGDQTIIIGVQMYLDHRSLSSIGQNILMTLHLPPPSPPFYLSCSLEVIWMFP